MSPEQSEKCSKLFSEYYRLLLYISSKILKDSYLAEEAVQESFLRVIKNIDKIDDVASDTTKHFLVMITRNISITLYNKRNRSVETTWDSTTIENTGSYDESDALLGELYWEECLRQLPLPYKEVLLLMGDGYSLKEIAEILDISYENVRKRAQRAKAAVLKIMKKGEINVE